jgi:UDP-N-acetylmuramoyl-tripeptide--D-alanyl-D-alanine ligase
LPVIQVSDTSAAYTRLSRHVRQKCRNVGYVGITGSAGKTTTKEFTSQLLSSRWPTYHSPGNWNNWIGLPFSLLNMPDRTRWAIFELAMSSPGIGEIDHLASILQPDIAVILNALPVHLEYLKTVENVRQAKSEILNYSDSDSIALVNGDDPRLVRTGRHFKGKFYSFGTKTSNDMILRNVEHCEDGASLQIECFGRSLEFKSNLHSEAHVQNLFASILIARLAGLSSDEIQEAVGHMRPLAGRGLILKKNRWTLIDETYNSNPEAVRTLLEWVSATYSETKVAVLGDMLELGSDEEQYHRQIGSFLLQTAFELLVTVGPRARWIAAGARDNGFPAERIFEVEKADDVGEVLLPLLPSRAVVAFKASRGIGLETALNNIIESES